VFEMLRLGSHFSRQIRYWEIGNSGSSAIGECIMSLLPLSGLQDSSNEFLLNGKSTPTLSGRNDIGDKSTCDFPSMVRATFRRSEFIESSFFIGHLDIPGNVSSL
jgi:hypothetical protein